MSIRYAMGSVPLFLWLACSEEGRLWSEEKAAKVTLPTDWKAGTRYRIEYMKERRDTQDGKTSSRQSTTVIDVEVKERLKEGYVFVWTHGETRLEGDQAIPAKLQELLKLGKGIRLELQTDATGVPETILNQKEVVAASRKVESALRESAVTEEEKQGLQTVFEEVSKPALIVQTALKPSQIFYFLCGSSLVPGEPSEYEDRLPNPFGGEPFPCKGRILLTAVDREKAEARMEWTQQMDPERTAAILKKTMSEMTRKLGKAGPKAADLAGFKIEDAASYQIDTITGLPKLVHHSRTSTVGGRQRVESMRFRLLPAVE